MITVEYHQGRSSVSGTCPMSGCSQWYSESKLRGFRREMDLHLHRRHSIEKGTAQYRLK